MKHTAFVVLLFCEFAASMRVLPAAEPLPVFILAGQSNMQGHADLSTLPHIGMDPRTKPILTAMIDENGTPRVDQDVWITSIGNTDDETEIHGPLTSGFGAGSRREKLGPEWTFGIYMHEHMGRPILIIKTAWGGKSLHTDFRPPSAGAYEFNPAEIERLISKGKDVEDEQRQRTASSGAYYRRMIRQVRHVLADISRIYPQYDADAGYQLAGFVWFQGWNDMVDQSVYPHRDQPGGYDLYSRLMAQFIRDVRSDLDSPQLPFVIGVFGVGGPLADYPLSEQRYAPIHKHFRDAMAEPANLPEFADNVSVVLTENYWDAELEALKNRGNRVNIKAKELQQDGSLTVEQRDSALAQFREQLYTPHELEVLKGSSNAAYHYLGSAKILAQIGRAFADAMADLQTQ